MRIAFPLLAAAVFAASPALAAEPDPAPTVEQKVAAEPKDGAAGSVDELQKRLADPKTGAMISAITVAMTDAMMDMKVGPMVAAAEGRKPTRAEKKRTMRDMVEANDPKAEQKIKAAAAQSGQTLQAAGAAMAVMLPKLIEVFGTMGEQMEEVVANLPRPVDPAPKDGKATR